LFVSVKLSLAINCEQHDKSIGLINIMLVGHLTLISYIN